MLFPVMIRDGIIQYGNSKTVIVSIIVSVLILFLLLWLLKSVIVQDVVCLNGLYTISIYSYTNLFP